LSRINSGGISTRNPFGPSWGSKQAGRAEGKTIGEQVQDNLFGKPKPKVLDQDDADTAALMARLHSFRKRIARLAGDEEEDYDLILADGTIAMIDDKGLIYVGKGFLLDFAEAVEVQVGVLAHEIGHRPKRWGEYKQEQVLTKDDLDKLCRLEETRADYFAGRALAELGLSAEPLCRFLKAISTHPHPQYFSAELRAEAIMEGHGDGARKANNKAKFFPEFSRMTSAKGDLGVG
jgi:hypothetical protein